MQAIRRSKEGALHVYALCCDSFCAPFLGTNWRPGPFYVLIIETKDRNNWHIEQKKMESTALFRTEGSWDTWSQLGIPKGEWWLQICQGRKPISSKGSPTANLLHGVSLQVPVGTASGQCCPNAAKVGEHL